jgi:hypothetical protein
MGVDRVPVGGAARKKVKAKQSVFRRRTMPACETIDFTESQLLEQVTISAQPYALQDFANS